MPKQDNALVLTTGRAVTNANVLTDTYSSREGGTLVVGSTGFGAILDHKVIIRVGTAFAGGTNITFNLLGSNTVDGNGDLTSATTVNTSGAVLTAALTANTRVAVLEVPPSVQGAFRYFQVQAVPSGTFTAGNFDAYITLEPDVRNTPVYPIATIA